MSTGLTTAILPVAGNGTRLLPATKSVPKELMPIYDRPLIQVAVDEALASGIRRLVLVSHPSKKALQDYFQRDDELRRALHENGKTRLSRALDALDPTGEMELVFVHQTEPLGLGHAILCARDVVEPGPVGVILPDDVILSAEPTLGQMARAYDPGFACHMIATEKVPAEAVSSYGIAACEEPAPGRQVLVEGLVEKPAVGEAPSRQGVIGRYILDTSIFDELERTRPGAGGEIQLTDAIAAAIGRGGVSAFRIDGARYDCGNPDGLLAASLAFRDSPFRRPFAA